MNHTGTMTLETERLILRPFKIEDAQPMYENWANDEEVTRYLSWEPHRDVSVTKEVLSDWIKQYENDDYYQWAMCLKDSADQPIGSIGTHLLEDDIRSVAIGYCMGKAWWRQGIMTEAFTKVIRFLFEEVDFNRIHATHDSNNPNSGHVMIKCGLQKEGHFRQSQLNSQGDLIDEVQYSILAEDYFK